MDLTHKVLETLSDSKIDLCLLSNRAIKGVVLKKCIKVASDKSLKVPEMLVCVIQNNDKKESFVSMGPHWSKSF